MRSLTTALSSRLGDAVTRFTWLEGALVALIVFLAELYQDWDVITGPFTFESDARLHEYWMRRYQDPEVLHDPLTQALLNTAYIPYGFRAIHWAASWVVDPVRFAEAIPLVLAPLCAWLVFRIVRMQADWRPAAWLGSLVFILAWDMHRFTGGHQRAYGPVILLAAVYLLLRRRDVFAAAVAVLGALVYPSAAAVAVVTMAFASVRVRPHLGLDVPRALTAVVAGIGALLALVLPLLIVRGNLPEIVTRTEVRNHPDFGPGTDVHFFAGSLLGYLSQKASGFGLALTGSILVVAALVILAVRWRNALLLRRELWSMLAASLVLFTLAQLFLFRLYLPHRYAYAIVPFAAILIAVSWEPTWRAAAERIRRPWLLALVGVVATVAVVWIALTLFPFGLRLGLTDAVAELADDWWRYGVVALIGFLLAWLLGRPASPWVATSAVSAALLVGFVGVAGSDRTASLKCKHLDVLRYLERETPPDVIIAGNPVQLDCVGIVSRRGVVIAEKLFQVWEVDYWQEGRRRMLDSIEAYYGDDPEDLLALRGRYGADYLVVERGHAAGLWKGVEPFASRVRELRATVARPTVRHLPPECVVFEGRLDVVYDLACVADRTR